MTIGVPSVALAGGGCLGGAAAAQNHVSQAIDSKQGQERTPHVR